MCYSGGLSYLIQWTLALCLYFVHYPSFKHSLLIWSVPLSGLFQSLNAMATFWFLPKNPGADQGYFSDKRTMSYAFISENSFFALILFYQWVYLNDDFRDVIQLALLPEVVFVFLPCTFHLLSYRRRCLATSMAKN